MRILHIAKKYPPALGGDALVVEALRGEQIEAGHDVTVVTSRCPGVGGPGVVPVGMSDDAASLDGIGPRRLVSLGILATRAGSLLDSVKPDVIHSHSPDMGFAVSRAARLRNVPTIHTCHIVEADRTDGPSWKRRVELELLTRAGHRQVVALTNRGADALSTAGIRNVVMIPHGIAAVGSAERALRNGPLRLLGVGRLERHKGFDLLIDAYCRLEARRPGSCTLRIVGDGSQRAALTRQAAEAELRVDFVGAVDKAEMPALYAEADVFVLSSRFETGPLVFFEAWAAGLAAIAFAVGAPPEIATDGSDALLIAPGDVAALVHGLTRLVDDPGLVDGLGRAGAERVRSLPGWQEIAARYNALYAW